MHLHPSVLQGLAHLEDDGRSTAELDQAANGRTAASDLTAIARNVNTSPATLARLAAHDTLARLAAHDVRTVQTAVAANPNTPSRIVTDLARSSVLICCHGAVRNPNAEPALLAELAVRYPDELTSGGIALHPNATEATLTALADTNPDAAIWSIVWNPNAPAALLARAAESPIGELRADVAAHQNTAPDTLTTLARHPDPTDRARRTAIRRLCEPALAAAGPQIAAIGRHLLTDWPGTADDLIATATAIAADHAPAASPD